MSYKEMYESWLSNPYFDEATKAELKSLEGNEKEIEDRFYRELEFGTAGLRGVIGAGTNRMNIYTVRKATQGLANYILKQEGAKKGVAIAFLNLCVPLLNCPMRFVSWAVLQVLILRQAIIRRNTTDIKFTGKTVRRSHRPTMAASWRK